LTHFFATAGVDALRTKSFPTVETWNSVYVVDLTHEDDQVVGEAMRTRSLPAAPAKIDHSDTEFSVAERHHLYLAPDLRV
jgi:hypothetical protein